ncbi:hypothetical protein MTBBW1_1360006 [Desulfamplus magnetovallimortis]|uniref:Uncharacterized protein n=1 Tax=Desulfamplus magnetovallimortis TaxID=1246637 RepID=A0A1W1H7K8_9BACT|nr:hypothetical protein MTBBW1_1360006 [Desulfamplus magnetovallimortis]
MIFHVSIPSNRGSVSDIEENRRNAVTGYVSIPSNRGSVSDLATEKLKQAANGASLNPL